jgi:DNA polymerase-3 subunit gamma/tau
MISLARRYRPKRFSDLLVQDHVAAVLRGAVSRGRVAHGYLLTGPRGVGKTTAARILAMALNCAQREPSGDPCGECENCLRIWNGSANLDVVEIDAASNRGVDDARDLRERAMYAASREGHHKVYIVDEAHMLTREAWNALLKILEEPPPGVVFVFATTEPQKIAAAAAPVMSRLQRFDFRRIGPGAIRDRLREVLSAEHLAADDDALTLIARHADGGMRDALSVLDQCLSFGEGAVTVERVREILGLADDELYGDVLQLVVDRNPAAVFPLIDRLTESGLDLAEFMAGAAEVLRGLLILQVGAEPEGMTEALRAKLESYRTLLEPGDVLRMLRLLAENEQGIRRSVNPRLVVETLLLRWAMLDRIVDLEEVLAGKGRGAAGPRGQQARRPGTQQEPTCVDRRANANCPAAPRPRCLALLRLPRCGQRRLACHRRRREGREHLSRRGTCGHGPHRLRSSLAQCPHARAHRRATAQGARQGRGYPEPEPGAAGETSGHRRAPARRRRAGQAAAPVRFRNQGRPAPGIPG